MIAALENGFYQLDLETSEKLFIADPKKILKEIGLMMENVTPPAGLGEAP